MPLSRFHPAVAAWFQRNFAAPTAAQARAWDALARGRHTLVAAPTGAGKTLAAFLAALDALTREALAGRLPDETRVVYVSPLKALSNDIERNLRAPLAGIAREIDALGLPPIDLRCALRTGDTTAKERADMRKRPPHILVTTPESLYLLLTSESGRAMLASTRSVIVDEIHALAPNKRGAHLALSLERLSALAGAPVRIGLSATQRPLDAIAHFLVGVGADCEVVDLGHARERDLALELPRSPLEAVMAGEVWDEVYDRLAALIGAHRTTLVFANTRRQVERVTRHVSERVGADAVAAHHGSLSKAQRLDAEQRLKSGALKALVATNSLELGIDVGSVDLVCQLGSPRGVNAFLQRVGRSGHALHALPKGRLFPLSRDDLVECAALLHAVAHGDLDDTSIPSQPLDVLAQQIVAEVAAREWDESALYERVRSAWPYRRLTRADFDAVVAMLADGFSTRLGRVSAYLHRDAVNARLRPRKGARLTALTCGGAIPDNADYNVVLEPTQTFIGTLNEDFAIESLAGDVFQLGNCSYRILRVESGVVRVEDAKGQPPNIPFWLGEGAARSDALSRAVARLRAELDRQLPTCNAETLAAARAWLAGEYGLTDAAAAQIVDYLGAAKAVLGALPTQARLVLERFFDESGGMQLVIHAPFGARVNRALGLALRKRFCRKFNFELQAAAVDDALVLSLGETHSFPLDEVTRYLHSASAREVLVQALLDAPLFTARWRWVGTTALALRRFRGGRKTPPPLLRMQAEDLIALVFPDQLACAENLSGPRAIPDHPLVRQTLADCLNEAMDVDGFLALLRALETGAVAALARDLPAPSPLAQEILNARPYAFLDDAPLEERRARAVMARRWSDPTTAEDLGRLDADAIHAVAREAWPQAETEDELHDALMTLGVLREDEAGAEGWGPLYAHLRAAGRATVAVVAGVRLWVAAERQALARAAYPDARLDPPLALPVEADRAWDADDARRELVRGRVQVAGVTGVAALAHALCLTPDAVQAALAALEREGFVLRGRFTPGTGIEEWCERRLLARIHRHTLERLRAEIEPVSSADFLRFLLAWQGVSAELKPEGIEGLAAVLKRLDGFEAPAAAWETDLLPARLKDYDPAWLDALCQSGRIAWARLCPEAARAGALRSTPIALCARRHLHAWRALCARADTPISSDAQRLLDRLRADGASFFDDAVAASGLLKARAETALSELVAAGRVNADGFRALRALLLPARRARRLARRRSHVAPALLDEAGRFGALPVPAQAEACDLETVARLLLDRYGVVFRRVLARESRLPPWHRLLDVYRRLEARGEIRGGRFVAGVTGEQFALPDAVATLRGVKRMPARGEIHVVSAADPLNLVGLLTPGARLPAIAAHRLAYRDGVPIAFQGAGALRFLVDPDPELRQALEHALGRRALNPRVRAYLA